MRFYQFSDKEKRVDIYNERFYPRLIDGKTRYYRNVTTILGIIDKGYAFNEWLKNVGHNAEIIVDRAGRFGTDFHQLCELFLRKEKVKYTSIIGDQVYMTSLWERFNIWLDFYKEVKPVPKEIEFIVYSDKYEYAGTSDLITDNQIYDWKTGSQIGNPEKLQMVAYMRAYEEMTGKHIEKANLVHVPLVKPNKKGYRITEVPNSDELFDLFLSTKKVFDMENTDKPKILTLPLEVSMEDFQGETI